MSGAFGDSVGHYDTTRIYTKWTQYNSASVVSGVNPRLLLAANGFVSKTLPPQNGWTVGFDWTSGAQFPVGTVYQGAAVFIEPGFTGTANLISLVINSDGTFSFTAGSSNILGTTTDSYKGQTDYYIEISYTLSGNPIGVSAELKINGKVVLDAAGGTGVNNGNLLFNGQTLSNQHSWFGSGTGVYIGNIYINNNLGTINNSYMGAITTGCIYPRQDVSVVWNQQPTGGPGAYALINEHPPDDDTTYIYDGNIGDTADFYFDEISTLVGQLQFLHFGIYARRDNSGYRAIEPRVAGSSVGSVYYLSDVYSYYFLPMDQIGGGPLTVATVNGSTYGIVLES